VGAGHTSSTRRGATIYELADDHPGNPWCVLARRVLDELQTSDVGVRRLLDAGNATGKQIVVTALYEGWSRKRFCFRALANATGTTTHNIEKHYHNGRERLRDAPKVERGPDALDLAWQRYKAFERLMSKPPGRSDGGSAAEVSSGTFGSVRVDVAGTHWPEERWQPPGEDEFAYGETTVLPQDADATRDVLEEERRRAARRLKVDTSCSSNSGPVQARTPSRCPAARRAHLSEVQDADKQRPGGRCRQKPKAGL